MMSNVGGIMGIMYGLLTIINSVFSDFTIRFLKVKSTFGRHLLKENQLVSRSKVF
jgi:hypothetical protein